MRRTISFATARSETTAPTRLTRVDNVPRSQDEAGPFAWIEFYEEVAERLLVHRADRATLIEQLRRVASSLPVVNDLERDQLAEPRHERRGGFHGVGEIVDDGCFLERARIESLLERLRSRKNLILQGPPGRRKPGPPARSAGRDPGARRRATAPPTTQPGLPRTTAGPPPGQRAGGPAQDRAPQAARPRPSRLPLRRVHD